MFWSSDKLTGSQTTSFNAREEGAFWSSDKLTGSQTVAFDAVIFVMFWSSDKLTGSQTSLGISRRHTRFGAVTN